MFIFSKRTQNANNNKENIFFILGDPTRVWPCSYVFPLGMKNQDYIVLCMKIVGLLLIFF